MKNVIVLLAVAFCLFGCGKIKKEFRGSTGAQGATGASGNNGVAGVNGINGFNGADGANGTSCSVVPVIASVAYPNGGAVISCGTSNVFVQNGSNGSNGSDGQDGSNGTNGTNGADAVVEIIDPCGDASGIWDEVLVRLASGQLLGSFSDNASGLNTRFAIIGPGSYQTTDASGCHFTVNNDLTVTF